MLAIYNNAVLGTARGIEIQRPSDSEATFLFHWKDIKIQSEITFMLVCLLSHLLNFCSMVCFCDVGREGIIKPLS